MSPDALHRTRRAAFARVDERLDSPRYSLPSGVCTPTGPKTARKGHIAACF